MAAKNTKMKPPSIVSAVPVTTWLVSADHWLESEALIANGPSETGYPYFVTRRGQQLAKAVEPLRGLTDAARLAAGLHPPNQPLIRQQLLLSGYKPAAF